MSVKRFIGKDAHSAMQQVRKEFGSEAIIIANRETNAGVEIVAADSFDQLLDPSVIEDSINSAEKTDSTILINDELTENNPPAPPGKKAKPAAKKPVKSPPVASSAANDESAVVQQEINELRNMLEGLARAGSISTGKNGAHIGLSGKLLAAGFGAELVRNIMDTLGSVKKADTALQKTTALLEKQLPLRSVDFLTEGGVVFFHGPAGAGKTTVLCKLAAQFLAQESASKIALIDADSNTIGNHGLLRSVGELLGVPVNAVHSGDELANALRQLRRKHLILVDTGSLNADTLATPESLPGMSLKSKKTEHCLVVPANLQTSVLDHLFGSLSESPVQTAILTRIDETVQPGMALDSLMRSSMQLCHWSDSGKLHSPLHPANATEIIARTLKAQNVAPRTIINKMPTGNTSRPISEESLSSIPFG